jgi:hypothetical protein
MAEPPDIEASYIDYETFLSPSFSAVSFANSIVTSTNNASDTTVDLSTPLSRVLFDLQEIDTHIHDLTTKSALPLLTHSKTQSSAAKSIVDDISKQVSILTESYQRLEEEVITRHAAAEEVRLAASRLWVTIKIGRSVGRALMLGRTLEAQMSEVARSSSSTTATAISSSTGSKQTPPVREDHQAMVRAAYTLQTLKALFAASGRDEEGEHLGRINVLNTLRTDLLTPAEQKLRARAQQIIREFSLSTLTQSQSQSQTQPSNPAPAATQTYTQTEETKNRTISAIRTLYLLSPPSGPATPFAPTLLLSALQSYLQASLTSSIAAIARGLSSQPTLPRALTEVSARCQNIVALETLLATLTPPANHPLLLLYHYNHHISDPAEPATETQAPNGHQETLLSPLLASLDTNSLPSYFWRSLASGLSPKVVEVLNRGGVGARTLRGAREKIRVLLREAVLRGVEGATTTGIGGGGGGGVSGVGGVRSNEVLWEREIGVMVGSVVGHLMR